MRKDIIQEQLYVTFVNDTMLKSNGKVQIESHCMDNMVYDRNKDTTVTTDIIQDQQDVTFVDEEMLKSNEKTEIEFTPQIMLARTGIKKLM